jgi:hypothetical protein
LRRWYAARTAQREVEKELRDAFRRYIETRQIEVIVFERIPATELAKAILDHPLILKPLLAACNLAGRALKRDLKIDNIDILFDHLAAQNYEGASIFWVRRAGALGGEQAAIDDWQIKRDGTRRGVVEITAP